jgi:hypothetical protein
MDRFNAREERNAPNERIRRNAEHKRRRPPFLVIKLIYK